MPSNGQPSQPKPREWETDLVEPIVENGVQVGVELNRDGSHQLFADIESILFRTGGACVIAAQREQLEDGTYVTTGYRVKLESFMPAVKRAPQHPQVNMGLGPQPAEEPEPESAPEPEEDPEPGPPPVSAAEGTTPEAELEPAQTD